MAYSTTVDISGLVDGSVNSSASVKTPIANIKLEIENFGNGVSLPEQLRLKQMATPSNPAAGSDKLYFKSDDSLYRLTSGGTETLIGPPTAAMQAVYINTARTVLGANAASVTISSIPSTYKHLRLILEPRTDVAATSDVILLRFNADATAANYYTQYLSVTGATVASAEVLGTQTGLYLPGGAGSTASAGNGRIIIDITDYASTTMRRCVTFQSYVHSANTTTNVKVYMGGGDWTNTSAAISSITFLPSAGANILAASAYTLYGYN